VVSGLMCVDKVESEEVVFGLEGEKRCMIKVKNSCRYLCVYTRGQCP